ncbi:MAG: DnaD domain protein [Clostridia bacterium]|nr:DnaD domain protein [Clostridia bacterium]
MKKKEKIQIDINYGASVTVLPTSVAGFIDKAKKFDLKVLFLIASSDKYREGNFAEKIAKELKCEASEVENSISFWNGTGVISVGDIEDNKTKSQKEIKDESTPIVKRARVSELPEYSSSELNSLLEKHHNVVELIDECQNILGKMFTASDIKVIVALIDYLGLDNDYILVLMHYAARNEYKSIRYIEKIAISCVDDGFVDAKALQIELHAREEREQIESKIKNVFGIGSRKFTTKEQKQVNLWVNEYKFELEVIEKAYDITISATNKPSIHYAHAILEKWYAEGIRTLADVDALLEKREQEKSEDGTSFNVDEFFNAALSRSYSDEE